MKIGETVEVAPGCAAYRNAKPGTRGIVIGVSAGAVVLLSGARKKSARRMSNIVFVDIGGEWVRIFRTKELIRKGVQSC